MLIEITIIGFFLALALGVAFCFWFPDPRSILRIPAAVSLVVFLLSLVTALGLLATGSRLFFARNVLLDQLALLHVILVNLVFLFTSVYATGYFKDKIRAGILDLSYLKRFCMLWLTFQGLLLLVILSNNIGVMWVALEATTLVSSFLIISDAEPLSIEAMWKYLMICSVGIVFAFMGTILTVAAAKNIQGQDSLFLFSQLLAHADLINPRLMLLAFIFIAVGFGTKAGLAPMHTWLPDAHSQAPTPVSAVFSGVMLNVAFYCIMRYLPVTEAALGGSGQARSILLLLGFLSLIFAAVFIPIQTDLKRFLAYCSVEHMGIIAVGLGLGGLGTFAALLHTVNHSFSKVLAFFSAGHIGDHYRTRDMRHISGAVSSLPLWGPVFFLSLLVLIGVAPFSVFMSEFLTVKAAFSQGRYLVVGLFLFCALAIFISSLKHVMGISFGGVKNIQASMGKARTIDWAIALVLLAGLLLLGVWIPAVFGAFLQNAAAAIEGGGGL